PRAGRRGDLPAAVPHPGPHDRRRTRAEGRLSTSVMPSPVDQSVTIIEEHQMLRVAGPNKGGLAPAATQMLREAGYRQRTDDKDLTCLDSDNEVEFFYLLPRDIATYVGSGELDLGVTGRDLMIDAGVAADEVLELGFGVSTFRFAARPGRVREI